MGAYTRIDRGAQPAPAGGAALAAGAGTRYMSSMVRLDRIYTRGGDGGETSLGDGSRVPKTSLRVAVHGDVDEASAAIGLARRHAAPAAAEMLARVQNDLFDLGADVARPGADPEEGALRIGPAQVARVEREIDAVRERLAPLATFVLRGGGDLAAALHLACTVCRRAERTAWALAAAEDVNPLALAYLNRLSDLLFAMARDANDGGRADQRWEPGRNAGPPAGGREDAR